MTRDPAGQVLPQRRALRRLSIFGGNAVQLAGLFTACAALAMARAAHSPFWAFSLSIAAWVLLYLFCHAIAHWGVGSAFGIRFVRYTVGGTSNPQGYPGLLRWIFQRIPFFGVQTEKSSMLIASPRAKALMWLAGVTSSIIVPTVGAFYAWEARIPGSRVLLAFSIFWSIGTLSSNWRSKTGDFAKAKLAFHDRMSTADSGSTTLKQPGE